MESEKTKRIEVADALRGFALLGIIMVHNIEHFDLSNVVQSESLWLSMSDQYIRDVVFFLFSGKAYAIFALLFGFSFYIQYDNSQRKGTKFPMRFAWRMFLLFCFGLFHVMFYSGEILSVYAVVGLLFIPLRNLSNRIVIVLSIVCMLEPWEMGKLVWALCNPDYLPTSPNWGYYFQAVEAAKQSTTFIEVAKVNLDAGFTNAHLFAWNSGRYFQTLSLFLIGALLGRQRFFVQSEQSDLFWKRVCGISIIGFGLLYALKINLADLKLSQGVNMPFTIMVNMWSNFAFMAFLVSSFVLLWFHSKMKAIESKLSPYGKMSLTNYVMSSVIGSVFYYSYGMGMFACLGATFSFLFAITIFILQLFFSKWWLKTHRYGPFEGIWHRLTWIKALK